MVLQACSDWEIWAFLHSYMHIIFCFLMVHISCIWILACPCIFWSTWITSSLYDWNLKISYSHAFSFVVGCIYTWWNSVVMLIYARNLKISNYHAFFFVVDVPIPDETEFWFLFLSIGKLSIIKLNVNFYPNRSPANNYLIPVFIVTIYLFVLMILWFTQAANYLNIKGLLDLTCQTVADMIKGKTPEEIRKTFNIKNDFTPEEEEEVRRENQWAFEWWPIAVLQTS